MSPHNDLPTMSNVNCTHTVASISLCSQNHTHIDHHLHVEAKSADICHVSIRPNRGSDAPTKRSLLVRSNVSKSISVHKQVVRMNQLGCSKSPVCELGVSKCWLKVHVTLLDTNRIPDVADLQCTKAASYMDTDDQLGTVTFV